MQVYKVMAPNRKIYALKRIRLTGRDREAAAGFIDEITLLQRLRGHSNIIQLIDAEVRHRLVRKNTESIMCHCCTARLHPRKGGKVKAKRLSRGW